MRYDRTMGDAGPNLFGGMNEAVKAQALALAPQMTDGQAEDLQEIVDATRYGGRTKWTRYGLGAVVGVVVGVVAARTIGKRRK